MEPTLDPIDFHISSDEQKSRYAYCRQRSSGELVAGASQQHSRVMQQIRSVQGKPMLTARRATPASLFSLDQIRPSFRSQAEEPHEDKYLKQLLASKDYETLKRQLKLRGLYTRIVDNKTVGDLAAERGLCDLLYMLHESMAYDFNKANNDGMVPFHYAIKKRQLEALKTLQDLGASADTPLPALSRQGVSDTPLHVACSTADKELLNVLLDHCRVSLNVVDSQNNSPLHRACLEDSLMVVKILVPHLTEPVLNMQGHEGKTALHIAMLNQNREIVRLLLTTRGALVDIPADNGRTVIDILLELNNRMLLNDFVYYYTVIKLKRIRANSFHELSNSQQFKQYLFFLSSVDNEFHECIMEMNAIGDTEKQILCQKLQDDDRIDLIEFKEVILKLLQTEDIHFLIQDENDVVLTKIVENIVHYVLFREDAALLERIMACGVLWSKVSRLIEEHIDSLYVQAPEREANGIVRHFRNNFVRGDHVDHNELSNYYGDLLSCYNLRPYFLETNRNTLYMRHPMNTLPVWAILSGRMTLTELFLRQEQFDVVPLSLFCAGLLRTFPENSEIVVEDEEIEELALTCEKFARKVVENVTSIDTSYNRSVSIDYLLRPLESYGGVSCLKLAASNECAYFLQSELCQKALEKKWFRSLLHMNVFFREIVIWFGAIPMNILAPLLLLYFNSKEAAARQRHEEKPFIGEDQSTQRSAKFQLYLKSPKPARQDEEHSEGAEDNTDHVEPTKVLYDFGTYRPPRRRSSVKPSNTGRKEELVPLNSDNTDGNSISEYTATNANCICHCAALLLNFYQTPAVKFRYHVVSHIVLVALMSYFLLISFKYEICVSEILAYTIIAGLFMEEVGEIVQYMIHNDIRSYFRSKWNLIDLTALFTGFTGFVIRMIEIKHSSDWTGMMRDFEDSAWYAARVHLSICCTLYWIRLLYISNVLENLGPKLRMIAEMITKDLLPFLLILFTFILGFGVLMHSLLYPNGFRAWNSAPLSSTHVLLGMLKICFYSMVGEYSLDTITGDESCDDIYQNFTRNEANCPHKIGRYLVPYLILPLYVIVTEILLLNLIIAMFSKTIETIDSRSKDLWLFERHNLIQEFETRSSLPPPFNIFDLVHKLVLMLRNRHRDCCNRLFKPVAEVKTHGSFNQRLVLQYLLFQALCLRNNRYMFMQQCLPKQETEAEKTLEKVRKIVEYEVSKLAKTVSGENGDADSFYADATDADQGIPLARTTMLNAAEPLSRSPQTRFRRAVLLQRMLRGY